MQEAVAWSGEGARSTGLDDSSRIRRLAFSVAMGVDTPTAERASRAIRGALEAQLPDDAWVAVDDLIRRIDAALDAADNHTVGELAGQLETVRASAVPPSAMPNEMAPSPPGGASGTRRGRLAPRRKGRAPGSAHSTAAWWLITAASAAVTVALASLIPSPAGDSPPPSPAPTVDLTPPPSPTSTVEPHWFDRPAPGHIPDGARAPDGGYDSFPVFDGLQEIELVWRGDADLDLEVTEPHGTHLTSRQPRPTSTGGQHGGDDSATTTATDIGDCKSGSSREVVSWPKGAPAGEYLVEVVGHNVAPCPGHYALNVRTVGPTLRHSGSVGNAEIDTVELHVLESSDAWTTDEAGGGRAQNSDGDAANGKASLLALGAGAAVALAFVWIMSRIIRPRPQQNVHMPDDVGETAPPVRPLLLAPEQLREVANHTIHRLDVLSS